MYPTPDGRRGVAPARVPRRGFVAAAARTLVLLLLAPAGRAARAATPRAQPPGGHPTPRPDAAAARVLSDARLGGDAEVRRALADAREVPQVLDGLRCHCPCGGEADYRSLLSCFEGEGMARDCGICRGQARLARRLHGRGRALADIRAAVDARYGTAHG